MKTTKPKYREPKERRETTSIRLEDSTKTMIKKRFRTVQKFVDRSIQKEFFEKE